MCLSQIQHHIYHQCKLANYEPEPNDEARAGRASGTEGTPEQEVVGNRTPIVSGAFPIIPFINSLRGRNRTGGEGNGDIEAEERPPRQSAPAEDTYKNHLIEVTLLIQCSDVQNVARGDGRPEEWHCPKERWQPLNDGNDYSVTTNTSLECPVCVAIEDAKNKALKTTRVVSFNYTARNMFG